MPVSSKTSIIIVRRYKTMAEVMFADRALSLGFSARKLRVSRLLTQQELANMAGVSSGDVSLLEHNLPLPLDSKRRLLKALWSGRGSKL